MKKFLDFLSTIISTFFFVGFFPFASGTAGSFAGLFVILIIFFQPYNIHFGESFLNFEVGGKYINPDYIIYILIILSALLYIIGVWASERYSKLINQPDPKKVVIDEVAGMFTATAITSVIYALLVKYYNQGMVLYLTFSIWFFIAIFFLFRLFDVLKPWHAGWVQNNLKGGIGIMLDDQFAALYSVIVFYIGFFILYYFNILDEFVKVS
jgi:phosphatidylglycerophosphatase A